MSEEGAGEQPAGETVESETPVVTPPLERVDDPAATSSAQIGRYVVLGPLRSHEPPAHQIDRDRERAIVRGTCHARRHD